MNDIAGSPQSFHSAGAEPVFAFGRERRMHARAYDYWVSLLGGRPMPALADLDPEKLDGFAGHSVIVDLTARDNVPAITYLGRELRDEAQVEAPTPGFDDVPAKSLLGQLLRRFPDILAYRAPVGFEAEHVVEDGRRSLHRGILLPLAGPDGALGGVYGVINWKLMACVEDAPDIASAIENALASRPARAVIPAWGDGPGALAAEPMPAPQRLDQQLSGARTWAALAETDRTRGAATLHAALGAAHDFLIAAQADTAGFCTVAGHAQAGEAQPHHAVTLVFGPDLARRDRIAFIATLRHAQRLGVGRGALAEMLDRHPGGYMAFASAERRARRIEKHHVAAGATRDWLAGEPVLAEIELMPLDPDFLLLIGRRTPKAVEIVARVPDEGHLTEAALSRLRAA